MFAMAFRTVNYESNTAGFQLTLLIQAHKIIPHCLQPESTTEIALELACVRLNLILDIHPQG